VGSSPTGRATSFIFNDLCVKAFVSDRLLFRQMDRHGGIKLFFSLLLLIQLLREVNFISRPSRIMPCHRDVIHAGH